MKKKFYSFFILLVLASFNFQCKQESSTINTPQPPGNPVNPDPVTANLQGNVVDENGNPASGVTVQVGAKTTTSNANGFFRIEQAGLDKQSSVVTVQKNGYFKAYRSFCATNGTNQVEIKLVKKTNAGTIASASGGTVTLPDGTKITLPAAGVVKQGSTTAYSGNILVYATYLDPSSADISQTIPGSMMGDDKNGNRTTLQSFGLISVELESAAGEKLQMATGKKAQLTVAIPSSLQTSAPSTISMWYVDEQTGIWKEEGTATKTGTNYVGEVSHFTFWGLNVSGPAVLLTATLKNAQNVLLPYTTVRIKRMVNGVANYGMAITDSLGQVSGLVPKDVVMDFQVMDYCSNIAYSQSIGPFTANTSLSVINANIPANYSLMVKGTAVNCNGQPIANAQVTVTRNYQQWYLRTNSTGEFQLNTLHCGTGNVTVQAHDLIAQQLGTAVTVPAVQPITNIGNVLACGSFSGQFINYVIDGNSYNLGYNVTTDTLRMPSTGIVPGTNLITTIEGYSTTSSSKIKLSFTHAGSAGTFPIETIAEVNGLASPVVVVPSTVTITSHAPMAGLYYQGTFTGQFKETPSNVNHTISGSFRLFRRFP